MAKYAVDRKSDRKRRKKYQRERKVREKEAAQALGLSKVPEKHTKTSQAMWDVKLNDLLKYKKPEAPPKKKRRRNKRQ